ncbi:MAG: helix-turn-helix transcriptional regulator [Bilifractor sp.]|jgi:predicted DNA-binding transcriptional regulator YafY
MARKENQKLKLLYLLKIFQEETDDEHSLTMAQIIERLSEYEIPADRKTLYLDFAELGKFGYEIISEKQGRKTCYHLGNRLFELPELKMLVDSVQAAKFITDRKSRALIKKLESLVSRYEARELNRQVVISGRVKTVNKKIYYNVDKIYEAINQNRQITFHYFQWNARKEQVLRHNGALYQISPWCLMWDDEYYYLVAYEKPENGIRHFRVDKMLDIAVTEEPRDGLETFRQFDVAKYAKSLFGMYGGEETTVTLEGRGDMAAVLIDRFGNDIMLIPREGDRFTAHVNVIPSRQFLGWVIALGDGIRITGPKRVVRDMREISSRLAQQYSDSPGAADDAEGTHPC